MWAILCLILIRLISASDFHILLEVKDNGRLQSCFSNPCFWISTFLELGQPSTMAIFKVHSGAYQLNKGKPWTTQTDSFFPQSICLIRFGRLIVPMQDYTQARGGESATNSRFQHILKS